MRNNCYDLVVIGSGPAGQKGAIAAAKLGKRVAIVDRTEMLGGVCVHNGTIPSKTLREAILYLTGYRQRAFYGDDYVVQEQIGIHDLTRRVQSVVDKEAGIVRKQLRRNHIDLVPGTAQFIDPRTIAVEGTLETRILLAEHTLIACGTRPARHAEVPFDGVRILSPDQLCSLAEMPKSMIVVGAGVIGLEYASMLAALGVEVTITDQRQRVLDFVDTEIAEALCYHLRRIGAAFRMGEQISKICLEDNNRVTAYLTSGKRISAASLLYAVGRQANTDTLNMESAGLEADERGKLAVDESYRTQVSHIFAAGDVIGFPSLASTSMEQGRLAVAAMFGAAAHLQDSLLPYGIYTIPEISMVGRTEQTLTQAKIPYEVGVARYEELAKGQMVGDDLGMLKLLFDPTTLKILGVHAIGENAAEIVHVGQAVMALDGTMEYFRDTVFNYPTFAEAYKVAAHNGLNRL